MAARRAHDYRSAVLNIFTWAGGTDAKYWTGIMESMYARGEHSSGFSFSVMNSSEGEESDLK